MEPKDEELKLKVIKSMRMQSQLMLVTLSSGNDTTMKLTKQR